jgi:ferredoxin
MTYIVAEPCVECKYTDCAAVCPVEAFHELPDKLLINPDTCIDCDACLPECPVEAIFSDMSIPEEYMTWLEINKEAENYPIISTNSRRCSGTACKGKSGVVINSKIAKKRLSKIGHAIFWFGWSRQFGIRRSLLRTRICTKW